MSVPPADVQDLNKRIAELELASRRYSAARLILFAIFVLGLLAGLESETLSIWITAPALLLFFAAFVRHGTIMDRKTTATDERTLLEEALQHRRSRRLEHRVPPVIPEPTRLQDGQRVYAPEPECQTLDSVTADDLDLLSGPRNLYAFLDRTSTALGSRRLRHMLLHPLRRPQDVNRRQEAVREMAERDEIRTTFLRELVSLRRHDLDPITGRFAETSSFAGRYLLFIWAHFSGTLAPLCIALLAVTGDLQWVAGIFLAAIVNMATIGVNLRQSNPARDHLLLFGPFLDACLRLRGLFSKAGLKASTWAEIDSVLKNVERPSRRLKRHVNLLGFHGYGVIFEIVNTLTLWELRVLPLAATVFKKHRMELEQAAGAFGDAESLVCLSLPLAEEEGYVLPEAAEQEDPCVDADGLGHPLLEPDVVVRNPLSLGTAAHVWIVTGSNMSGKSTYLKTAGLNLVLAGMGGPVCARHFRWTPVAIYTDMNVRDSLDDGKSYFQVEVERVRRVVETASRDRMLFAVFDELFRGTNSYERLAISRAIIRHIRDVGALSLVATHDRTLTRLVTEDAESGIDNRHLRETVDKGVMRFDYRLREGASTTRNAIRVLEAQGYPANIIAEARSELDPG